MKETFFETDLTKTLPYFLEDMEVYKCDRNELGEAFAKSYQEDRLNLFTTLNLPCLLIWMRNYTRERILQHLKKMS